MNIQQIPKSSTTRKLISHDKWFLVETQDNKIISQEEIAMENKKLENQESSDLSELSRRSLDLQYELNELGALIHELREKKIFFQKRFLKIQAEKTKVETEILERKNEVKKLKSGRKPSSRRSKSNQEVNSKLIKDLTKALKGMSEEDIKSLIENT